MWLPLHFFDIAGQFVVICPSTEENYLGKTLYQGTSRAAPSGFMTVHASDVCQAVVTVTRYYSTLLKLRNFQNRNAHFSGCPWDLVRRPWQIWLPWTLCWNWNYDNGDVATDVNTPGLNSVSLLTGEFRYWPVFTCPGDVSDESDLESYIKCLKMGSHHAVGTVAVLVVQILSVQHMLLRKVSPHCTRVAIDLVRHFPALLICFHSPQQSHFIVKSNCAGSNPCIMLPEIMRPNRTVSRCKCGASSCWNVYGICVVFETRVFWLTHQKCYPMFFWHSFTTIEAGADLNWGTCPRIFRQPAYEMQKFRSWSWWNFTSQSKIYWNLYQDLVCIPKQTQQGAALKLMGEIDSCDKLQFSLSFVCLQLYLM